MKFRKPGRAGSSARLNAESPGEIWLACHQMLDDVTPIVEDCGHLCGARCCAGGPDDGMLLFPGEEALYGEDRLPAGWTLQDSTLVLPGFNTPVRLLVCDGTCTRTMRPMSCRIFPLLPVPEGSSHVRVVPDLRALSVCPLLREDAPAMRLAFLRAVGRAFETALVLPGVRDMLTCLQEENRMLGRFLHP